MASVLSHRLNDAAVSEKTVQAGARLILMEYPVRLNNNPGAGGDQRGKWVPGRCTVMVQVQAPSAKQLVESNFRPNWWRRQSQERN